MSDHAQDVASSSSTDSMINWVLSNRLKAIGYVWLGGVGGSMAYQWTRPIPMSLKLIHSRVYAQAITLGALGAVAAVELYAQSKAQAAEDEKKE